MQNNKRFALSALAFAVALALVSCKPLQGHAVEISIDDQTQIQEYLEAGGGQGAFLDWQWSEDEDGNRNTRLTLYGIQQLAFQAQSEFYERLDFGAAPSSVTFSGGGGVAFYRRTQNGEPVPATVSGCMPGQIMASSEDFNLVVSFRDITMNAHAEPYYNSTGNRAGFVYNGSTIWHSIYWDDLSGYLSAYSRQQNVSPGTEISVSWNSNFIPVIASGTSAGSLTLGLGQNIVLPSGTVDTSRPWDYYNNVVLPYIREEFPGYEDYYFFPDGYQPPAQPSTVPVEYPTLPGFDLALETNGTEPASEYAYEIPDMPTKDIAVPAFDLSSINPAEVMAPVADHLRSMWALVTGVLTEFGLFPYVAIAVFAAIIAGLLHLGK